MARYGISIPDDLSAKIDAQATLWRINRSQAITRIFLEWEEHQAEQPRLLTDEPAAYTTAAAEMKNSGAKPLFERSSRPAISADEYEALND